MPLELDTGFAVAERRFAVAPVAVRSVEALALLLASFGRRVMLAAGHYGSRDPTPEPRVAGSETTS